MRTRYFSLRNVFKEANVLELQIEGMHMKTQEIENIETNETITDLVSRDQIVERINSYLRNEPLNIENDDYCYIKIVGNHLEIGRAKITLVE
jgi:hypothetical protein